MNNKAIVTQIPFGDYEIEGLLLPDGTFGIAFPQVYSLFLLPQKNGSRTLKTLLGKGLVLPQKIQIENLNTTRRSVSVLTLEEFQVICQKLAQQGNKQAQEFIILLFGLSLLQLWSDAFGIKFEKEERQAWLTERQSGKFYRRCLTDATKFLIDQGEKLNYGYITKMVYKACSLSEMYKTYKAKVGDSKFRDTLTNEQLRRIAKMEELTADYVIVDGDNIKTALEKAARYIR